MPKPHFYKHLDADSKLTLEIDMRSLAERLCRMNYGVHRLLSHLVDVRRENLEKRAAEYEQNGDDYGLDVARNIRLERDPLADAIEKLLNSGAL